MNNSSLRILSPYLLFIAIPLVIAVVVGFLLLPKAKRKRTKNIISLALHVVMCLTLAITFCDIQYLQVSKQTELYLVADCSASEGNSLDKIDSIVSDVTSKIDTKTTKVGLVAFANQAFTLSKAVELKEDVTLPSVKECLTADGFDASASDIESALLYTNDLYSDDCIRKMILISDGMETDNSAVDAVNKLVSNDVALDAISLNEASGDEVAVTGLDYVDHCYVNRIVDVKASIRCLSEVEDAKVTLTREGEVVSSQEFDYLDRGLTVVTFDLDSSVAGSFDYQITVSCSKDQFADNNTMSFTQDYTDKFKVCFVGDTQSDVSAISAMALYNEETINDMDCYIDDANPPYKVEDLMKYDEIILSDVNVTSLNHSEQFVKNLNTMVKVYGKSLLTFGATFSGNSSDDYVGTYNDMLPVQYETDEGKALVILIDRSGSMATDSRLEMAKQGAIACLNVMSENDFISIISFSDDVIVHQSLTSVKNKDTIKKAITQIQCDGGTEMDAGLKKAQDQLKSSNLDYKYVMTLSDGEPFDDDSTLYATVKSMAKDNITCSFINISNNDTTSINLLKNLAKYGNGTYYYCRSAASLQAVMLSNVVTDISNTALDEEDTEIQIRTEDDPTLEGVGTLPTIDGFNYCRIKQAATTVLTVQYQMEEDTDSDDESIDIKATAVVPLYAYWDYGKGKVSSFTSSLSGTWTSDFRSSAAGKKFMQNAVNQSLPERCSDNVLDMTYENNGLTTKISVNAYDEDTQAKLHIKVSCPYMYPGESGAHVIETDLVYDGTAYSGTIETGFVGKYTIEMEYSQMPYDDETDTRSGEYSVTATDTQPLYFDYSKEYDVFTNAENNLMTKIAKLGGGVASSSTDVVVEELNKESDPYTSYKSTQMFWLLLTLGIFLVDIFVRKSDFKGKKAAA